MRQLLLPIILLLASTAFSQSSFPPDDKKFTPIEPEQGRYITYTGKYLEMWKLDAWLQKVQQHYTQVHQLAKAPDTPADKPKPAAQPNPKNP